MQTKQIVSTLKMVPLVEAVTIPFVTQFINDEGEFTANEMIEKSSTAMLTELLRWAEALKTLR